MTALASLATWHDTWQVPHSAAAVVDAQGVRERAGDTSRPLPLASVSKLLTAYAVLVALEEGALELDEPAGPPGATVRHLLAHTAGYGFESSAGVLAAPGTRRIYSNRGIEVLAEHVTAACGIAFDTYLTEAVLQPLGMSDTVLVGSPAHGVRSSVDDLAQFAGELLHPRLLHPQTQHQAYAVQFPGLAGVLPGHGRFDPCDWGLGFERNFSRPGHWAGPSPSPDTVGHFGAAGTFLWMDPVAEVACVCLSDRDFGPWAAAAWPQLSTDVLRAVVG